MALYFILFVIVVVFLYIPLPWLIGRCLRSRQKKKAQLQRTIYLTFDDGPGNRLTPAILKILEANNIKATFFVLGRNVAGREAILKCVVDDGHTIASHSYSHSNAWKVLPWTWISDTRQGLKVLNKTLSSKNINYPFRPPCGKLNLLSLGYLWLQKIPIVFWTVDCLDTWPENVRDVDFAARKIANDQGGIVLFHDFDRDADHLDGYVLDTLNAVIKNGQELGLCFSTVDKLFEKV